MPTQDTAASAMDGAGCRRPPVRMITSAKGGVGKSTVCANLGMALALRGQRVLLIDGDRENRSLDLMLGMEDRILYGLTDVLKEHRRAEQVILAHPEMPRLRLLPASPDCSGREPISAFADRFSSLMKALADGDADGPYDQILIDLPGGLSDLLYDAAHIADDAVIISSAQTTAIRSAEHTASLLADAGLQTRRLIINAFPDDGSCFRTRRRRTSRQKQTDAALALISVMDTVSLPLLGVIPFDPAVWDRQNRGLLINDRTYQGSGFRCAAVNIAARLCHVTVPLFSCAQEKQTPTT